MNKTTYKQYDDRWRWWAYPGRGYYLNGSGCGCLSVFHCLLEAPKFSVMPVINVMKAAWEYMRNYAVCGDGTLRAGITEGLKHFGFTDVVRLQERPMSDLWKELKRGSRVGVLLFGGNKGPDGTVWTLGGHYIAYTDYMLKDGKHWMYLKDSGGRNHSGWYCYENSMRGDVIDAWAAKIPESPKVEKPKPYSGDLPELHVKKATEEVIRDAIAWSKMIAADNSFHYGYTSSDKKINAHHNGCYFCGTNTTSGGRSKKGIVDYEKTYCCNPFVHACWAHGGQLPAMLKICQRGSSYDFSKGKGYDKSTLFKKLGKPKKSSLKAGDVLCNDHHVVLYIGNGKLSEAAHGDDNKRNSASWNDSIHIADLTDSRYKGFTRVYRLTSSVDADIPLRFGELSERVKLLQQYLNWYNGKTVVAVDGMFGSETLRYVKAFQAAQKLSVDGVVGKNTITKMKGVKK